MINEVYTNGVAKSSLTCPYPPKTSDALSWGFWFLNIQVRYNLRSQNNEWRQGSWINKEWVWNSWEMLTTRSLAVVRSDIQKYCKLTFGREAFAEALDVILYYQEIDPLKEYFESLPEPTGRNILPKMLSTCMNVADGYEKLAEWASVYMFLGVVWRTFEPGTKLDEIPILVGPGGIGKSTVPAMAVPLGIPGLYGSGLELSGNGKVMVEAIQGRAICEISEMVGASVGDMARIKDFISRVDDAAVRLSYRRDPEPSPRRCIMVGTADRDRFLPRDNNLRRFVPIVLDPGDARKVRRYMDKNRERLWGEAVALYRLKEPAYLPERLKARAQEAVREAICS